MILGSSDTALLSTEFILPSNNPDSLQKLDSLRLDSIRQNSDIKTTIYYNAEDSMHMIMPTRMMYLYKKADLKYDNITLKADYVDVDWNTNILRSKGLINEKGDTTGKPLFTENADKYQSESIGYNFKTRRGAISQVATQYGESYIHGTMVNKNEKNELYIGATKYTTCDLAHPHFYIYSKKSKLIPNDKIITGPFYMAVADVPTPLGFLFGVFPSKKGRASGLLIPAYGESQQLGFSLENGGYYLAISEYMDLAMRGNIYSKGAWGINLKSDYLKRYRRNGRLEYAYNSRPSGEFETEEFTKNTDYKFNWTHSKVTRPGVSFSASVNFASSSFYKNSVQPTSDIFTNNLQSNVSYSKSFAGTPFNMNLGLTHSQQMQDEIINLGVPRFNFNMRRVNPFKRASRVGKIRWYENIGTSYSFNAVNELTVKEDDFSYDNRRFLLDTMINGAQHSIPVSTSIKAFKYFTFTPSFNYTEKWSLYSKDYYVDPNDSLQLVQDSILKEFSRYGVYSASISLSTNLYGYVPINGKRLKGIRHKLTPAISFTHVPDFSDKKWGYYAYFPDSTSKTGEKKYSRYSNFRYGGPGSGKVGSIGMSLGNQTLEMKVKTKDDTTKNYKKVTLLEWVNLSSSYNLEADSLNLALINFTARTSLLDKFYIDFSSVFDAYVVDSSNRNYNQFEYSINKRLARLKSASIAFRTSFNNKGITKPKPNENLVNPIRQFRYDYSEGYVDFNMPWNVSVNYSKNFTYIPNDEPVVNQSLSFSGSLKLTEKWNLNANSGFDFTNEDFSYTSINITRDLHCWLLTFNWIPTGTYQSYRIEIHAKSDLLKDLKLTRKRDWFDR